MTILVGTRYRFSAEFRDTESKLSDPSSVLCVIILPNGAATRYVFGVDPQLARQSTGTYYIDHLLLFPGDINVQWGSLASGEESYIQKVYRISARRP